MLPLRAKFIGGLPQRLPHLIHVISQGNGQQSGASLASFITLVNQHHAAIEQLTFLNTGYLHRHYQCPTAGDPEAADAQWREHNAELLNNCQVAWSSATWSSVVNHPRYSDCLARVQADYHTQPVFKAKVDSLAAHHQAKKDPAAAQAYLLEECSGSLVLAQQGATLTYPSGLNAAVRFTLHQHDTTPRATPRFLGYKLVTPPRPKSALAVETIPSPASSMALTNDPDAFSTTLAQLIDRSLPLAPKLRCDFLNALMGLCRHYSLQPQQQEMPPHGQASEKQTPETHCRRPDEHVTPRL